MSLENDPIVTEFVIESREHLANIENQLLAFEVAGADIDEELVNTVFRAVHSIKGASGFLGFSVLGKIAHKLENVFNLIRNRELILDSTNVDVMLKAADSICEMIEDIGESENYDIDHHVVALQQITDAVENPDNDKAAPLASVDPFANTTRGPATAPAQAQPQSAPERQVASVAAQAPVNPSPPIEKQRSANTSANTTPADSNIRVSVGLLDNLMNLAGELVLSRNQLLQKVEADGTAELDSVAARLDQVTSELQEAIMQTRMQAIGTVFGKFPRVVRDLSRQLGKKCELTTVSGRGVGMDVVKTNIEKLGGAVSIETAIGTGTTINVKLPLTLAIVPSLIVRSGGRCLALPQTNIRELVRVQKEDVVTRIERVKNAEVFRLRGRLLPLVRLNDAMGVDETDKTNNAVNIIVVEAGSLQYGLIVDGLHDSEEIVVKPLGRHMQECETLAGATILGDGQVALILDVSGIASHFELAWPEDDALAEKDGLSNDDEETQASLLFSNQVDEHFGITMEVISRLERVRTDQIDSVGGMKVLQYRGASLPLLSLEKHIRAKPRTETKMVYVVVFSVLKREVGLIVPHLVDIQQITTKVDTVTFRELGVVGSVEIDDKATRLLDLYELTKLAHPEWFDEDKVGDGVDTIETVPSSDAEVSTRPVILLAEDSGFFRKQVTGFLEDGGCEVVGCEDGLIAWNVLLERAGDFDLVLTDVEMPNMDGCQLAQHIKDDPSMSHLPIIALTSLSSEADMQRGIESGIDDYQVKLDRDRLMSSVNRYLTGIEVKHIESKTVAEPAAVGMGI